MSKVKVKVNVYAHPIPDDPLEGWRGVVAIEGCPRLFTAPFYGEPAEEFARRAAMRFLPVLARLGFKVVEEAQDDGEPRN